MIPKSVRWDGSSSLKILKVPQEFLAGIEEGVNQKFGGRQAIAFARGDVIYAEEGDALWGGGTPLIAKKDVKRLIASGELLQEIETRIAIKRIQQ